VTARRVLTPGHLNRALLARQLLLERADLALTDAIEQMAALQDQNATALYVGLWSRVRGVERAAVTQALEDRTLIQGTLMRGTIHVVTRRQYWRHAVAVRQPLRDWFVRTRPAAERKGTEAEMLEHAGRLRAALADGPRTVKELDGLATGFVGNAGLWVNLVRVPPSGTWERRRADRLALAESWVGPEDAGELEGRALLVRSYLTAFGPAPWKDIAQWAGVGVADLQHAAAESGLELATYGDEAGRPLIDLPDAPLPDPDAPAPVRFLPHWDAITLAHARRSGVLPEPHRAVLYHIRNPASMGTVLVDGRIVAGWRFRDGTVALEWFEAVGPRDRDAVEDERLALEVFSA
jgi:hypothetical protein